MKKNKIQQAEQRTVKRSDINFASYNPRVISEDARKKLKKNLQTVGLLGGVIWNERTGNLVSGHQKVSIMDTVNRYDTENGNNDYELRVEVVDFDEKTEKEQNLFMNNRKAQGQFDEDMLREMLNGIDFSMAGFDDFDMEILGLGEIDDFLNNGSISSEWDERQLVGEDDYLASLSQGMKVGEENHRVDRRKDFYEDSMENQLKRHNEIKKIKNRIARQNDIDKDGGVLSYVVISFRTPSEKMRFMETYGLDPMAKYVNGEEFQNKLEFGDQE